VLATLPFLLSLAPVPGVGSAHSEVLALQDQVSEFRSICLERIADAPAQRAAAVAPPWNFTADPEDKSHYNSGTITLMIDPAKQACMLTATVPPAETVASVQTAMTGIVPAEGWKVLDEADSRYVLISLDDGGTQFVIMFKIAKNQSGRNVATLAVEKR
jgi:hypothetical protein